MELDHIFIRTTKGAPEGDLLLDFGLVEGTPNTHPGQGTANRRFFFHNMMIELLWIDDYEEVQSERTKPMRLFERLSTSNPEISPFGICFRPSDNSIGKPTFATWDYKPQYLPNSLSIQVGSKTPLCEPMWFYVSFAKRSDSFPREKSQPINNKLSLKEVTAATVTINNTCNLSEVAQEISKLHNFKLKESDQNLLELEFDYGREGKFHDFRPDLPLIFRW